MSGLLGVLFGDEAWRLHRGKPTPRGVRRNLQSFGSRLVGDRTSSIVLKDKDIVWSLTESVSRSDQKIVLDFWSDYPDQLVIAIVG